MRHRLSVMTAAIVAALATQVAAAEQRVVLRADTNRDGRVDLVGDSDEVAKDKATLAAGALVLPNIDDDSGRCKPLKLTEARQACYDGADDVVNGDDDLLDLAVLRTVPVRAPSGVTATVRIEGAGAAYGRLFAGLGRSAANYSLVTPQTVFTAAQLRKGLNLRLEAATFARDLSAWDGTFTVAVTARRGARSVTDRVVLRVAPLLTHTHAQKVERLFTSTRRNFPQGQGQVFVDALRAASEPLGIPNTDFARTGKGDDEWAQDYTEPMYASVPLAGVPGRTQGMHVLMRSEQHRDQQWALFAWQGKDWAVAAITEEGRPNSLPFYTTYDSFGNLETIPAHAGYPAGRQILGGERDGNGPTARYQAFLAAQAQNPLRLDTGWLFVGHVDEFVSFVPAPTRLGFRILVADVDLGLAAINEAIAAGLGDTQHSTSPFAWDKRTISQVLADPRATRANVIARERIAGNLATILNATGASEADVVRIPSYFEYMAWDKLRSPQASQKLGRWLAAVPPQQRQAVLDQAERRLRAAEAEEDEVVIALYPGAVNLVALDATHLAMADQHAPLLNGADFMQTAILRQLAPLGLAPQWIEDYAVYHNGGGEVHCGSNTVRAIQSRWWPTSPR